MTETLRLRLADWGADGGALRAIRAEVFMHEQNVPEELEWDGLDADALHLLAETADGSPIGTARMLADGHIGRVAVLRPWRGQGVGMALMSELLRLTAERGFDTVWLDAQTSAIGFYERLGFIAEGPEFDDAGIPHRHMHRALGAPKR